MADSQSKQARSRKWLPRLALGALAAMPAVTAFACNLHDEAPYPGPGGGGPPATGTVGPPPGCIGPNCPEQCAEHPHPGCKCDIEGQHLLCGKVEGTYPDGTGVCGKGVSVCTNGVWGQCTINNAVTLVPEQPPGYWATGFGPGSTCLDNPCDPGCVSFDDSGNGLSSDGGITGSDAGVTLTGDGGSVCVPKSCVEQGKNCGPVSDTCGGLLQCGTCVAPMTCGGGGVPSVCGLSANCTNLCLQQVVCPNSGTTSLTGKVFAPNGVDPLPNAVVYVPNAPLTPFSAGVSCDNCLQASGSPLVSTTSGVDGSFTLTNMPVGANIPLVIQIGRWRRQVTIPQITACTTTDITPAPASSCGVVIEQVYGGGGLAGATYKNDFVVLHNKGPVDVDVSSWSLQFATATGTAWSKLNLTGSVAPGGFYLIRLAGSTTGATVPAADRSTNTINMDATNGKVAIVRNQTTLSGTCPAANIVDFVGYGTANCSEGSSALPALSSSKSASRKTNGCADTNVNSADFTVASPVTAPRNSAAAESICSTCNPLTRFARNKAEGDIPKIAFVTGQVDAMECVFRKIGIDDSEFTNPSGTGRIAFYWGGYSGGTYINASTPGEFSLVSSPTELAKYDMVLFPCQGGQYAWNNGNHATFQDNIADYVDAGGRIFTTHFNYIWLYNNGGTYLSPLSSAVNWQINQSSPSPDPQTGYIDQSFPKGQTLAQWLQIIGASTTQGQISINTLRRDFSSVVAPTQRWMYLGNGTPMHLTFNTPLGAAPAQQCGRVVYSDFHVYDSNDTQYPFPNECAGGAMTPQEKLLEYMLFDLASCVAPDIPPACATVSCAQQGLNCGMAGDGCGNTIDCGTCAAPTTCGGGGLPGVCGTPITYADGYFVRDYDATGVCPDGTGPVWRIYSWAAVTPGDSRVEFTVQTAPALAALGAAPADQLQFSNPPGPVALVGQPTVAHTVNVPPGAPDTQIGAASPDYTLLTKNRIRGHSFVRVTAHLVPTSDGLQAPTLSSWNMQIDCLPNQ